MSQLHEKILILRQQITDRKRAGGDVKGLQAQLSELYKTPPKVKRAPKIAIL